MCTSPLRRSPESPPAPIALQSLAILCSKLLVTICALRACCLLLWDPPCCSVCARTLFGCATVSRHLSKVFVGLHLMCIPPPIHLHPPPPPLACSSLCYAPLHPARGTLGHSRALCSPATYWHHCQINRSLAVSLLQLGAVRQQPDRPSSLPFSPACPPHIDL
jgi:hypothetical protein